MPPPRFFFGTIVERSGPGFSGVSEGRPLIVRGVVGAAGGGAEPCASGAVEPNLGGIDEDAAAAGGTDGYARAADAVSGRRISGEDAPMPGAVRIDGDVAG